MGRIEGERQVDMMREESGKRRSRLAETAGLTLGLEEAEDVVLTDCRRNHVSLGSLENAVAAALF